MLIADPEEKLFAPSLDAAENFLNLMGGFETIRLVETTDGVIEDGDPLIDGKDFLGLLGKDDLEVKGGRGLKVIGGLGEARLSHETLGPLFLEQRIVGILVEDLDELVVRDLTDHLVALSVLGTARIELDGDRNVVEFFETLCEQERGLTERIVERSTSKFFDLGRKIKGMCVCFLRELVAKRDGVAEVVRRYLKRFPHFVLIRHPLHFADLDEANAEGERKALSIKSRISQHL